MSRLILKEDAGGLRHYLEGRPVHCGAALELQAVERRCDDDGSYDAPIDEWVAVRYEASCRREEVKVSIYAELGGHMVKFAYCDDSMSFRWPESNS